MKQLAYILFSAAFVYYASWSAGRILLRLLKISLYRSEERFFNFVLGAGCLSLLVFGIAAVHLAYKGVFLAAGISLIVVSRLVRGGTGTIMPPLALNWRIVFWAGYSIYAVLYVANGVLPETSSDGTFYHVALPAQYYRAHSLPWLTSSLFADLSQGIEMLFLFAYPFGKQSGAAMVHVLFLLALPLGILSYARRYGMPAAGVIGGLLFFMSPIVGKDGISAYVDVAVAAIVFAVFYFLQIWAETRDHRLLVPIGLLAGFAFAAKYVAFAAVLYALVFVAYQLRKMKGEALRAMLVVSGCAAIMMAPWLIRNTVVVANPVSPFGNEFFRNPFIHVSFERTYAAVMSNFNGVTYIQLPWELCVSGRRLIGLLGPVFLLSVLGIGAVRNAQGRQLLIAAAISAGPPLIAVQTTRWWITALPFIAVALAIVLCRWRPIGLAVLAAHALLSWPALVTLYCGDTAWRILDLPWRTALRIESEEQYLTGTGLGESYEICKLINKIVPQGQAIFANGHFPRSYVDRDVIANWEGAFGELLSDALGTATRDRVMRNEYRFPKRQIARIRLLERDKSEEAQWGINEMRFYNAGQELSRAAAWRLSASPNPWDVRLAFDNNPVTRWSTWEPYKPGMYVEVAFGSPAQVDEIVMDCWPDQSGGGIRLQAWSDYRWRDIDATVTVQDLAAPARMRRAAIEVLKANGLHWFLFNRGDWGAKDFVLNHAQWGITLAGASQEYRLYHLD